MLNTFFFLEKFQSFNQKADKRYHFLINMTLNDLKLQEIQEYNMRMELGRRLWK